VSRFIISDHDYTTGFQQVDYLDLTKSIFEQIKRERLVIAPEFITDADEIKKIIEKNSSLRINFGWAFKSRNHFTEIMEECIEEIVPLYDIYAGQMVSDNKCSWLGFVPFNAFEKVLYEKLSSYSLVLFNNELINFQIKVIEFIIEHEIFKKHAILKDKRYRFNFFKSVRKNSVALCNAYRYYLDAIHEIEELDSISTDKLEEDIGCHFLYQPDLYFELLEFSILKGEINGRQ